MPVGLPAFLVQLPGTGPDFAFYQLQHEFLLEPDSGFPIHNETPLFLSTDYLIDINAQ